MAVRTEDARQHEIESVLIPLNQLKDSPNNVRQVPHDKAYVQELAASLHAHGQLQNLIVEPERAGDQLTGCYLVNGGKARRLALLLLVKQKKIKADHAVRCLIDTTHDAVEVSTAENRHAPMHGADEFEAFRAMIERGSTVEDVATRFGVTPLVVQRRLKLANVCPDFIVLYRKNVLTMAHLQAFALTDDHDRQRTAWKSLPTYNRSPELLRDALVRAEVPQSSAIARFVGEAYAKAGGQVRQDLFSEAGEGFIVDVELLNRLGSEKLDKAATRIKKEGFAWVETALSVTHADRSAFSRARSILREPTEEEAARLKALAEETDELQAEMDALDGDDGGDRERGDVLEARFNAIQEAEQAIEEARTQIDPRHQAVAGAMVSIGHDGKLRVERGLIRAEDRKRLATEDRESSAPDGEPEDDAPKGPHSAAFTRALTAHRTLALQVEVAHQPQIALAALTHRLIVETLRPLDRGSNALQISARQTDLVSFDATLKTAKAQLALDERSEALLAPVPQDSEAILPWLLRQPQSALLELLALCVALSLNGVQSDESESPLDELARAAALDMTAWWTASADGYFKHVSKGRIAEVVREAVSPEAASGIAVLKKSDAAVLAEQRVAGTGWLPAVLRTPAA